MATQAGGMVSRREEDFYPDNRDESFLGVAASRGLCIWFLVYPTNGPKTTRIFQGVGANASKSRKEGDGSQEELP